MAGFARELGQVVKVFVGVILRCPFIYLTVADIVGRYDRVLPQRVPDLVGMVQQRGVVHLCRSFCDLPLKDRQH